MSFDAEKLIEDLANPDGGEGYRALLYDDATGKAIVKGSHVVGNPTIGIGWNVAATPLNLSRAKIITNWQIIDVWRSLTTQLPWIEKLSDGCQRALIELAFNMGEGELLKFHDFLYLLGAANYEAAGNDLSQTEWAKQVSKTRVDRIVALIKGG